LVATDVAKGLLAELTPDEVRGLGAYLDSTDFEEITLHFVLGRTLGDKPWEDLKVTIREELRLSLRSTGIRRELLLTTTDVVFDALMAGSALPADQKLRLGVIEGAAHLTAAAAANTKLLSELGNLAQFHTFADRLKTQVAALHSHIRLPHLGVSRSVPYGQLYVEPVLHPEHEQTQCPELDALALPGRRSVILGDPGAGKSTLAAKLAHDVASNLVEGAEGRVPFLVVLRSFARSF
jgi:hypothetical protein